MKKQECKNVDIFMPLITNHNISNVVILDVTKTSLILKLAKSGGRFDPSPFLRMLILRPAGRAKAFLRALEAAAECCLPTPSPGEKEQH